MSDKHGRVMAVMQHNVPDRVPWGMWGHFPAMPFLGYSWEKASKDGGELARAHLALLGKLKYEMDLLKVTPFYKFMAGHWGSKFRFFDNNESVETVDLAVKTTTDWEKLWVLDPKKELGEHLKTVSILSRDVGKFLPFVYT